MPYSEKTAQKGQVLIIVLLITGVALTVGVGVSQRAVSTVQQATFSEESTQALHYAEACVEEALRLIEQGDITVDNLTYEDSLTDVDEDPEVDCEFEVSALTELFPDMLLQDDVGEVRLSDYGGDSLDVYWCKSGSDVEDCGNKLPALEIVLIKNSGGGLETERFVYNPPGTGRSDGFAAAGSGGTAYGEEYAYGKSISVSDAVVTRMIPRYSSTSVAVVGDEPLPIQGFDITATGYFGRSERTVRVTKTKSMPAIFDYVLFSGSESKPLEKE